MALTLKARNMLTFCRAEGAEEDLRQHGRAGFLLNIRGATSVGRGRQNSLLKFTRRLQMRKTKRTVLDVGCGV